MFVPGKLVTVYKRDFTSLMHFLLLLSSVEGQKYTDVKWEADDYTSDYTRMNSLCFDLAIETHCIFSTSLILLEAGQIELKTLKKCNILPHLVSKIQ